MFFAIGFLLIFTLDILLFFRFRFFGMIPLYFVKSAVSYFTAFILLKEKKHFLDEWKSILIYFWIFYLICISTVELLIDCMLYFHFWAEEGNGSLFRFLNFIEKFQWVELFLTLILLFLTIHYSRKQDKSFYLWSLFTLLAIFLRNLLIVFWNPLPVFLYQYFGVVELPGMFGLLMIIVTMVRKLYGFQEKINDV